MEQTQTKFSLVDVFRELVRVVFIAVGCYCGWKVGHHFVSVMFGGIAGRIVGVVSIDLLLFMTFRPQQSSLLQIDTAMPTSQSDLPLDEATKQGLVRLLGEAMSSISEESWYAGWVSGTEHYVPELCRRAIASGVAQIWGAGTVTPVQARGLCFIADKIGGWVNFDVEIDGFVKYEPFPIPANIAANVAREQTKA